MAYCGAQPVEKGKANKSFNNFKKFLKDLKKEFMDGFDELNYKKMVEEGKKTWAELKGKRKVKF